MIAAGYARIQVRETVYEVDEPVLLSPIEVRGVLPVAGHVMDALGFRYLVLHKFAAREGTLEQPATDESSIEPSPEQMPVEVEPEAAAV